MIGSLIVAILLNQKLVATTGMAHYYFLAHPDAADRRLAALALDAEPRCGLGQLSA